MKMAPGVLRILEDVKMWRRPDFDKPTWMRVLESLYPVEKHCLQGHTNISRRLALAFEEVQQGWLVQSARPNNETPTENPGMCLLRKEDETQGAQQPQA